VDEAQLSSNGNFLFGEAGESGGSELSRWIVTPQGFQFDVAGTNLDYQPHVDLNCQQTLCLTGGGSVVDTGSLKVLTQLIPFFSAQNGLALMDLDNNRMFLLTYSGADTTIGWYDTTTYSLVTRYVIPQWGRAHSFKKVAGDQLAIANSAELILLSLSSAGN
jgi:hypothetical protein